MATLEYAIILGALVMVALVVWANLSAKSQKAVSSTSEAIDAAVDTDAPGPPGGKGKGKGKGKDKDKDKVKGKGKGKGHAQVRHDTTRQLVRADVLARECGMRIHTVTLTAEEYVECGQDA